jgi:hypothetical protein
MSYRMQDEMSIVSRLFCHGAVLMKSFTSLEYELCCEPQVEVIRLSLASRRMRVDLLDHIFHHGRIFLRQTSYVVLVER